MRVLTLLLLPICAVLGGTLQMDKNLQYNCYYQILRQYSTKSSYEYEDYLDYSHRLDDQLHLNVNQNNNKVLHKHKRREILSGANENYEYNFSKAYSNHPARFQKGSAVDINNISVKDNSLLGNVPEKELTYFIVAPKIMRPDFIYKVSAAVLKSQYPIKIYANITCDDVHLTGDCKDVQEGASETLLLRMPKNQKLTKKECKLRLEGFFLNVFCDLALLHEKPLEYAQNVIKIVIQTDKAFYMQGDIVRFRVFTLNAELKGIDSFVEIYLLDPMQYVVHRWLKRLSNAGSLMMEYQLPKRPSFGDWTINVEVVGAAQQNNLTFTVEEYYKTHAEVKVEIPNIIFTTDHFLKGHIEAKYLSGEYVKGNLSLNAIIQPLNKFDYRTINRNFRLDMVAKNFTMKVEAVKFPEFNNNKKSFLNYTADNFIESEYILDDVHKSNYSLTKNVTEINGIYKFEWPLDKLRFLQQNINGFELFVTATISEHSYNEVYSGYAITRLYKPKVRLYFIGGSPQVFKPTMPFTVYIAAEFIDKSPLDPHLLKAELLEISGIIETDNGIAHTWPSQGLQTLRHQAGIWELKVDLRNDLNGNKLLHLRNIINKVTQFTILAQLKTVGVDSISAELVLVPQYSPRNQYIKVTTSTEHPTVGEYIIFHISANFFLENFNYMVISKDVVLVNERETIAGGMRTIALVASIEMAPAATIVVWSVTWQGQVVVDALTFPLDGIFRSNFSLNITRYWDGVEYLKKMIGVTIFGEPGSHISLSAISKQFNHLSDFNSAFYNVNDKNSNSVIKHVWYLHAYPYTEYAYYPSSSSGIDAHSIFDLSELHVLTDGIVPSRDEKCNSSIGVKQCMPKECFRLSKKCDGIIDCSDGSDENNCQVYNDVDLINFAKYRSNRVSRDYQNNLLWNEVEIGLKGKYEFHINDSSTSHTWILGGLSSHPVKGIGVIAKPIEYSSSPKFFVNVEMPSQCHKGEHIGIRVIVSNLNFKDMMATVKLIDSKDYIFVENSNREIIQFYLQQKTFGQHQLEQKEQNQQKFTIKIAAQSSRSIYIPIMPTTLGEIEVQIRVKTSFGSKNIKFSLNVENVGLKLKRHLTLILNLTKQNYFEYINATSISQLSKRNKVRISTANDVIGPIVQTKYIPAETAVEIIFAFAKTLYKLKYLRLISQRNVSAEKEIYGDLNSIYQSLLGYLQADGSFQSLHSDLTNLNSSVWLTAQCLRLFQEAALLKLENYIWIDPKIIEKNVNWLLKHQTAKGAFKEDRHHVPNIDTNDMTLTSHVLIALSGVKNYSSTIIERVDQAKAHAIAWIKYNMQCIQNTTNAYELAVTTYALLLCKSPLAGQTINSLRHLARTSDKYTYWSTADVSSSILMKARSLDEYDSLSIETTAYGLMVYVLNRDFNVHLIVNWLNANRMYESNWSSTRATAVALCALINFVEYRSQQENAAITVEIEASSQAGTIHVLNINNSSSQFQDMQTNDFWGTISLNAKGVGYGLLQFQIDDDVEDTVQPAQSVYNLSNKVLFHGQYLSHLTYTTCIRKLIFHNLGSATDLSVLDVTIPSGYGIQQRELDAYVLDKRVNNLLYAKSLGSRILFYFAAFDQQAEICINYTARRWFPVANLTRYLPMRVYELAAPEHYSQILYDASQLQTLSICDICGSSKCSNCLHYSYAARMEVLQFLFIVTLFIVVF